MGSGASLLQNSLKDNPELISKYRKEFTDLFILTFEQLKNENLTNEEINEKFEEILKENEVKLISKIAEAEQLNKVNKEKDINPSDLQHIINQTRLNYQKRNSLNFLVCLNGTEAGDIGFKSTLRFMNKYDTMTIFHAYNSNDLEHIPLKYQPKQIHDKYYSQLINTLPSNQFFFYFIDYNQKDITNAVKDYLLLYNPKFSSLEDYIKEYTLDKSQDTYVQHPRPDFLVVGINRLLLNHSDSVVTDESRPQTQHHQKNIIRRINSGPASNSTSFNSSSNSRPPSSTSPTHLSHHSNYDSQHSKDYQHSNSNVSTSSFLISKSTTTTNNNNNNNTLLTNEQHEQQKNYHHHQEEEPSVNAFMSHSHPPLLTKSNRGQSSGTIIYQDPDQVTTSNNNNNNNNNNSNSISNTNEYTILGTSDLTLQNIYLPCIIIKSIFHHIPQSLQQQQHSGNNNNNNYNYSHNKVTYVLAVNETITSKRGLDILKKLLNPKDTLRMVYMSARDTSERQLDDIRSYYNKEAQLYCPSDSSLVIIPLGGRMMVDVILSYSNEIQSDFIAVSPRANKDSDNNYPVSLTEQILLKSNCNVIICKN